MSARTSFSAECDLVSHLFILFYKAPDALGVIPYKPPEVVIKKKVPYFNLKVSKSLNYNEFEMIVILKVLILIKFCSYCISPNIGRTLCCNMCNISNDYGIHSNSKCLANFLLFKSNLSKVSFLISIHIGLIFLGFQFALIFFILVHPLFSNYLC